MYCIILKSHLFAQRVWSFFTTKNYLPDVMQSSQSLAIRVITRKIQSLVTSLQLIVDFSDRPSSELTRTHKTKMKSLRSLIIGNASRGSSELMTNLTQMELSRQDLLYKVMTSLSGRQLLSGMFRISMKMVQNLGTTLVSQLLQVF